MPGSFVRCDSFQQGLGIGADGGQRTFQVPVLDALHPLQQDVQRFLDVGEQGAGQVQIGEGHRRQQSSQNDGCIQDNEQLQPRNTCSISSPMLCRSWNVSPSRGR